MDNSIYDSSYYITGKQSGKSLYQDYRWIPDLTLPFCRRIVAHCGISPQDTVLDFGCARGYVVRALRELGYQARGIDASEWAVSNCDPAVFGLVGCRTRVEYDYDWIIAKDVLEHIPDDELPSTIEDIMAHARKGVFVVVPLSPADGAAYVVPEYEQDVTHVQRLTLPSWMDGLRRDGFCASGTYLVPGIKQNYSHFEKGNGFIICRREIE